MGCAKVKPQENIAHLIKIAILNLLVCRIMLGLMIRSVSLGNQLESCVTMIMNAHLKTFVATFMAMMLQLELNDAYKSTLQMMVLGLERILQLSVIQKTPKESVSIVDLDGLTLVAQWQLVAISPLLKVILECKLQFSDVLLKIL